MIVFTMIVGDYLYNLLLHNFFFEDTAYDLIGFTKENEVLFALVQQAFVSKLNSKNLDKVTL